jgi:hypothetical protein
VADLLEELRQRRTRAEGVSLRYGEMARLAVRTVAQRAFRGFRSI